LDRDAITRPRVVIAAGIDDGDIEIIEPLDRAGDRFARRQSEGGLHLVTTPRAAAAAATAAGGAGPEPSVLQVHRLVLRRHVGKVARRRMAVRAAAGAVEIRFAGLG